MPFLLCGLCRRQWSVRCCDPADIVENFDLSQADFTGATMYLMADGSKLVSEAGIRKVNVYAVGKEHQL